MHLTNGVWVDVTSSLDTINQTICGTVSSLSPFGIAVEAVAPPGTPVTGTKLRIKDKAGDPTKRLIRFVVKDPAISATGINPLADGAFLQVFNSGSGMDSACFPLAGLWTTKPGTFRYDDKKLVSGPVKNVLLKNGLLKAVVKGNGPVAIPYTLDEPSQGSVGVIFRSGATAYCANFGGRIKTDSGIDPPNTGGKGGFVAAGALPSSECPSAPATCP